MSKTYATPFADILPPLSTEERAALAADLEARGQLDPIYVDEEGNVLDGHNRLDLVDDPWVETISGLGSREEKEAFVLSRNLKRRNLSPDQKEHVRKAMKATAKKLREQDPTTWTQEKLAVTFGVSQPLIAAWEAEWDMRIISPDNVHKPKPDARIKLSKDAKSAIVERVQAGEPQKQVAADYGVTQSTVSRVVKAEEKKQARVAADIVSPPLPEGVFDLILADPPWRYDFSETKQREIENHYQTMPVEEIAKLDTGQVPTATPLFTVAIDFRARTARHSEFWQFHGSAWQTAKASATLLHDLLRTLPVAPIRELLFSVAC